MTATGVYRVGDNRAVGFALRGPGGVVILEQLLLHGQRVEIAVDPAEASRLGLSVKAGRPE